MKPASITPNTMRLYNTHNERLYLNAVELQRCLAAARKAPSPQRQFALTLAYTGCRLSEVRELKPASFQIEARVISVRSLKKRQLHVIREIPMPRALAAELAPFTALPSSHSVWTETPRIIPRITAYRWIKELMEDANISGAKACPRGLRHTYGTRAILRGVPLHMLQLWMGHASMRTTAIYATALGQDQLDVADKMW